MLHQTPSASQYAGIAIVVLAGAATQRAGRHDRQSAKRPGAHSELDLMG